jgi:hypothetical protein
MRLLADAVVVTRSAVGAGRRGTEVGSSSTTVVPVLHPGGMPRWMPWALAALVAGVNLAIHSMVLGRGGRRPSGRAVNGW